MKIWRCLSGALIVGGALLMQGCATAATSAPPPAAAVRADAAARYAVVPWPQRLEPGAGEFRITPDTRLALSDPADEELRSAASFLREYIRAATGAELRVATEPARAGSANTITLRLTDGVEDPEAYALSAAPAGVTISAATPRGVFYGVQTLRQLLTEGAVPAVEIEDAPRFAYRGMHLDVARHMFPVEFIKKYIDLLAMYKLNTFHWHLTEDQGWRIQIRRYPKLTEVGAFRRETRVGHARRDPERYDGTPYGGFYTQDQIREIVRYAQDRHVTIIPEIEMPGHATAALAAYPELACTEGPFEVETTWGIHEDIFCPKEETFRFLEGVLAEVMELFPGEYIHIGGDEAPKQRWQESPIAQAVMEREGLEDEHELQSYFIKRIERFLNANGRKLIGWDEIVEGGLSPTATVMYWRDRKDAGVGVQLEDDPANLAVRQGNDVIMTPNQTLYFDHYQADPAGEPLAIGGLTTLRDVYAYEPIPADFSAQEAAHVLGAQANVWTEYMKTPEHVEYMVFPRLLALSEVVWSPREARDWDSFVRRLPERLRMLEARGINYRRPEPAADRSR
jgi:hexosaminidase